MTYRAKATRPFADRDRAVAELRAALHARATAEGAEPDWSTFRITGPDAFVGAHGNVCYQWTAVVDALEEVGRYL